MDDAAAVFLSALVVEFSWLIADDVRHRAVLGPGVGAHVEGRSVLTFLYILVARPAAGDLMRVIGLLPAGAEIEVTSFAHPVCIGAIKF